MGRGNIPRRLSIIGAARSGLAAAKYLVGHDASVFVSDTCAAKDLDFILASNDLAQVPHEAGEHTDRILTCDAVVLSPGVPPSIPVLRRAEKAGIPVWSEIELAYRASDAHVLAVTGSSGKSTTVSLLGAILAKAGLRAEVAGNIGVPAIGVLPSLPEEGYAALEVSSFQLETIDRFHPDGAAVLNLLKNHLDRYKSFRHYCDAKKRIVKNMGPDDVLVLNSEDPLLREWGGQLGARVRVIYFGQSPAQTDGVWFDQEALWLNDRGVITKLLNVKDMILRGRHNYANAAAACALAHFAAGVPADRLSPGVCGFAGLAHRLEFVGEIDGVKYYNDSKATTAESMLYALRAFDGGVHLIAGGRDKGCDFSLLNEELGTRAKQAYLIGEAARRIASLWQGRLPISKCENLRAALNLAKENARTGEVVVLSPGCSSYDQFKDYEERGNTFRSIVAEMAEKGKAE